MYVVYDPLPVVHGPFLYEQIWEMIRIMSTVYWIHVSCLQWIYDAGESVHSADLWIYQEEMSTHDISDLLTAVLAMLTWGPPGAGRTQLGPMLATWTLLSG